MNTQQQTGEQSMVAAALAKQYGIDRNRVFFPDAKEPSKPWLGADELLAITRQSDRFLEVIEAFEAYIPDLKQVVHRARVVDRDGRGFERCGVATIGEKTPDGSESDGHSLAGTRALVATLSAAGFNPLRGSVTADAPGQPITFDNEPEFRLSNLREIHALAEEVGLVVWVGDDRDTTHYKEFLRKNYGVDSVSGMTAIERASVINKLRVMKREIESL